MKLVIAPPEEQEKFREKIREFARRHREACEETPNAVRRFMLTRTPRNAPLTKLEGLYDALEVLAEVVDDWMEWKKGEPMACKPVQTTTEPVMCESISSKLREAAELARIHDVPAEEAVRDLRRHFSSLERAEDASALYVFQVFYETLSGQEVAEVVAADNHDARYKFFKDRNPELCHIFRISELCGKEERDDRGDRCGEHRPSDSPEAAGEHFPKQVLSQRGDVKKLPIRHGFLPAAPMNGQTRLRRVRERVEHLLNRFVG